MTGYTKQRTRVVMLAGVLAIAMALVGCTSNKSEEGKSGGGTSSSTTSGASDAPKVTDVWARAAMEGGNTAIYFVIDGGSAADRLVSASVPEGTGASTEIHETVPADQDSGFTEMPASTEAGSGMNDSAGGMKGGGHGDAPSDGSKMMTMRPVDGVDVPAGGQVAFEPGGYHVMVMDLNKALVGGEELPVTLTFEKAGDIEVVAEVREP